MENRYIEEIEDIGECLLNIVNSTPANIIFNIRKMITASRSIEDKRSLRRVLMFLVEGGTLYDSDEYEFYKRILFGNENSKEYFWQLMDYLKYVDDEKKIRFIAMLCHAVFKLNLDRSLFERIYKTICTCTLTELYFIKQNIDQGIEEETCTITLFSLMQNGLVQKAYHEDKRRNVFYFTEYARVVYDYSLNFNGRIIEKPLELQSITIREDEYAINKVLRLGERKEVVEPIIIRDIEPYLAFSDKVIRLRFTIENNGVEIIPKRFYFAFSSSSGYYSCEKFMCGGAGYQRSLKEHNYSIQYTFDKKNLRSWEDYGVVFYFVVKHKEDRYIKLFHYCSGYTTQEISKEDFEKEIQQFDICFQNIEKGASDLYYIRFALQIMNYEYTK